jgi:hypothetical protein
MFVGVTRRFWEVSEAVHVAEKEKRLRDAAVDRTQKFTASEVSRQTSRFGSFPDALAHFRECRARTVGFVEPAS